MNQQNLPIKKSPEETAMFGFEKGEKSKAIPIRMLSESIRVEDNLGRAYKTRPIQAWSLLGLIVSMLKDHEIGYQTTPIIVRADSSGVALNDQDRAENKYDKSLCPVNKWIFDQLITKIEIPHIGDELVNGAIAVSYTQRGINVSLGLNVRICDNLSILGGQQMRTYKFEDHNPLDWETMKIHLRDWIQNLDQRLAIEVEVMNRMIAHQIDNEIAVDRVIGKLYQNAIRWRYFNGPQAPFDISGMSTFVQNVERKKENEIIENVWDLYNWGTSMMKPNYERIETLSEAHRIYGDFLCREFGIEREDLITEHEEVS